MTPEDIDRISRSLVGHLATDPPVRKAFAATRADAAKAADLINETVQPRVPVSPEDVPTIMKYVTKMFPPNQQKEVGANQSVLDHSGGHPTE